MDTLRPPEPPPDVAVAAPAQIASPQGFYQPQKARRLDAIGPGQVLVQGPGGGIPQAAPLFDLGQFESGRAYDGMVLF